ncbi:MAG: ATP synthase F1 subunit delta [Flavobacteriales bacterium]|nr:ATP synthase F1 subunit delta [Flavobacteriales bacterium]
MQGNTVLAVRYAQSLASLAQERGTLDALYEDMQKISSVFASEAEFRAFLRSPVINALTKQALLEKVFAGKVSEITIAFIKKLADARREKFLGDIADAFIRHYKQLKGILTVHVTSAVQLDDVLRAKIISVVKSNPEYSKASSIELDEKVDKNIIGGLIIRIGDKQIDASFATRIKEYRRAFEDNPYVVEY